MKFFRWILSHLTIIVVLSVIVYIYWSQYGFGPDEGVESTAKPLVESSEYHSDKLRRKADSDNIDKPMSDNSLLEQELIETNAIESQNRVTSYPSSDFSQRMREYKQNLSVEEQEVMDNAGKTFQQESKNVIKYPTDNDLEAIEQSNSVVTKDMSLIPQLPGDDLQKESTEAIRLREVYAPVEAPFEAPFEVMAEAPVKIKAEAPVEIKAEAPETRGNIEAGKEYTRPLVVQKKGVSAQDKKLQQQIRDRQKQLQDQMISLIPLDSEKNTDADTVLNKKNTNVILTKSIINTSEHKQLLNDARHAFDLREFKAAEEKYLQLIKQLPEMPDIVGELANVYRTQNKTPDYLVTNTQFVKRLVNHNRFDEAWKVVMVTDKMDKKTANKQRRIINKKQKDL